MTTDLQSRIAAIKAACEELLAIAEKRPYWNWTVHNDSVIDKSGGYIAACFHDNSFRNATFIAACAQRAEAFDRTLGL